jgi:hypothetical protein
MAAEAPPTVRDEDGDDDDDDDVLWRSSRPVPVSEEGEALRREAGRELSREQLVAWDAATSIVCLAKEQRLGSVGSISFPPLVA